MVYKIAKFARILRGHGLEATQIEYWFYAAHYSFAIIISCKDNGTTRKIECVFYFWLLIFVKVSAQPG